MATNQSVTNMNTQDVVLVIGDVGMETVHKGKTFWAGVGGTALNLSDALCDQYKIQTWLVTRTDPVHGWLTLAALERFNTMHKGLGSIRAYQLASTKNLQEVNRDYIDMEISAYLAVMIGTEIKFETYSGSEIALAAQRVSLSSAIDRSLVTVVDTRLTADTLRVVAELCSDLSRNLVVMSNGRQSSMKKFAEIGEGGGCDTLVLNPTDGALFESEDPCDTAQARFTAYVRPDTASWVIHGEGRADIAVGEAQFGPAEVVVDTLGSVEGFTGGYISARFFDELSLEDKSAAHQMTNGLKQSMLIRGGNRLSLRDPANPGLAVPGIWCD